MRDVLLVVVGLAATSARPVKRVASTVAIGKRMVADFEKEGQE